MVTIRLLGEAGRRFGRTYQLAVRSAAEAVRALCLQIPELRQYIASSAEAGIAWRVVTEDPMGLGEDELEWPCSKRVVLAPQPVGRGGVGKIIAGVALVAVSLLLLPGAPLALGLGFSIGGQVVSAAATLGVSLAFGGVAQLLTPTPKMPGAMFGSVTKREDQQRSALFDKSNANALQGDVVPVLYGERLISSLAVISFGLEPRNT